MKLQVCAVCVSILVVGVVAVSYYRYCGEEDKPQPIASGSRGPDESSPVPPPSSPDHPDALLEEVVGVFRLEVPADVTVTNEVSDVSEEESPPRPTMLPSSDALQPEGQVGQAHDPPDLRVFGPGGLFQDLTETRSSPYEPNSPEQDGRYKNFKERVGVQATDVSRLHEQCRQVEADLADEQARPRHDLLAMYGRSSAASGQFDIAAASYVMFLNEFGTEHPYSGRIAMRLGDCLAPFNLDLIDIVHSEQGPAFNPEWRMGFVPRREWLRQAVAAYELAADLAEDDVGVGRALLRTGWVYRALDDWSAAAQAWDRCALEAAGTKWAADALWLAAENARWTGQPAGAAERLRRMAADYPEDPRASTAAQRLEYLEAEALRSPDWFADPGGSVRAEIEARAAVRSPVEVYGSVVRWLRRRGERAALIAVSRWASSQDDWPVEARIACRHDLVDALLLEPTDDARLKAVGWLGEVVDIAPDDATAVPAAIRRYRLLGQLGQLDQADQTMEELAVRVRGSPRWEPRVLTEQIGSLLARGDHDRARAVLDALMASHPDYEVDGHIKAALLGEYKEESE